MSGRGDTPSVVYVLPDKIGGVVSYVENLLAWRRPDAFRHHAVLTHNRRESDTRFGGALSADATRQVEFALPPENLHAVLRRLRRAVGDGPGVLVANDWIELAMAAAYDTGRTVVSIVHGDWDYYYDLAAKHDEVIHAHVTYSRKIHARMLELLPAARERIFHLPYGVAVPARARAIDAAGRAPLRLLFVGRMTREKGIFDLPEIDRHLRDAGVEATWTVQGSGPEAAALQSVWHDEGRIVYRGVQPIEAVLAQYLDHDLLVFPCRSEGLPVALLEAMAAGVVPVVSDLESGVRDVVDTGVNGWRVAVGDTAGFARAVLAAGGDRAALAAMGGAARRTVVERYDVRATVAGYQELYGRWRELYRPRPRRTTLHYGSRLDRAWIPNGVTRALRAWRRQAWGRTR